MQHLTGRHRKTVERHCLLRAFKNAFERACGREYGSAFRLDRLHEGLLHRIPFPQWEGVTAVIPHRLIAAARAAHHHISVPAEGIDHQVAAELLPATQADRRLRGIGSKELFILCPFSFQFIFGEIVIFISTNPLSL